MSGLYRIKPLEWRNVPLGESADMGWISHAGWISYGVELIRGQWWWNWDIEDRGGSWKCESLEAGKAACEAHWRARLEACLEPVE